MRVTVRDTVRDTVGDTMRHNETPNEQTMRDTRTKSMGRNYKIHCKTNTARHLALKSAQIVVLMSSHLQTFVRVRIDILVCSYFASA